MIKYWSMPTMTIPHNGSNVNTWQPCPIFGRHLCFQADQDLPQLGQVGFYPLGPCCTDGLNLGDPRPHSHLPADVALPNNSLM